MARYDKGPPGGSNNYAEQAEAAFQKQLEAGEVIQMVHATKGVRYILSDERSVREARLRGWSDVEYEEEVVKRVVPKAKAEPKPGGNSKGPRAAASKEK